MTAVGLASARRAGRRAFTAHQVTTVAARMSVVYWLHCAPYWSVLSRISIRSGYFDEIAATNLSVVACRDNMLGYICIMLCPPHGHAHDATHAHATHTLVLAFSIHTG